MATPPATGPITAPYSPQTPAVSVLLMLVVTACTAWLVFVVSLNTAVKDLQDAATRRLDTAAAALTSALVRFDYLPALLETTPAVMELLARPGEPVLRDQANHTLLRINAIAGADMLFVLDERGDAQAAADWDQPSTTVGHNYTYRPYMKGALAQGRGRFFGVGATSRSPGLLPVLRAAPRQPHAGRGHRQGQPRRRRTRLGGAARAHAGQRRARRGHPQLAAAVEVQRAAAAAAERAQVLDEKPYTADPPLVPWVQADAQPRSGEQVLVDGQMHLVTALALPTQRWHMQALDPLAPAQRGPETQALVAALATAVACC
jgi:two-component system C4-dicarboxylate transport sensor histidine kinase DctB